MDPGKKCDFDHGLTDPKQSRPAQELFMDQTISTNTSHGSTASTSSVNSFYELGQHLLITTTNLMIDQSRDPPKPGSAKPAWFHWVNRKREEMRPVLYVAFGTQAKISNKLSSSRN
ncbi:unnamed protein product [Arabidopsis thaliana]|uniref:Uncharacterized protein n=1 Tax=Arabidopsis thaliana TaxID=3702 RepID=A0A5S9WYV8_ARATH|nr:unnamed protein product [Arabidopsis thaliana]